MTDHQILRVDRVVDGDTLVADLEHVVGRSEDVEVVIRRYNVRLRLINVDTPERGHVDFAKAKTALAQFLLRQGLRVRTYGTGSFGRLLADVYAGDETATQWLLRLGYDPYVPKQ